MSHIKLEIVTAERQTFADDVNAVIAPGIEGQMTILPHHAPLMTMLFFQSTKTDQEYFGLELWTAGSISLFGRKDPLFIILTILMTLKV